MSSSNEYKPAKFHSPMDGVIDATYSTFKFVYGFALFALLIFVLVMAFDIDKYFYSAVATTGVEASKIAITQMMGNRSLM